MSILQNKKVHVKTMQDLNESELQNLVKGLKNVKGFDFFIDAPFQLN